MNNLNFLVVFFEGVLSLLSPCVLPIIPVYIAILSGSTGDKDDLDKSRSGPIINTVLFILGISTTFFILGSSISYLSNFLFKNKQILNIIGGIIIMLMGLFFMGVLKLPSLSSGKTKASIQKREMGPLTAFLLGFTFSWGWSPCVGPMLTSAVMMAANTGSRLHGNLMILVYTLGFILPFLIIAIFYDRLAHHLDKIEKHSDKIKKIGGILLIVTGLLMATGGMDRFAGTITKDQDIKLEDEMNEETEKESLPPKTDDTEAKDVQPAIDFTLVDQYGETHTLSDYKGKVVFLNFWATWCPPCINEMPDIQAIYEERGYNKEDLVILGVAMPNLGDEGDIEHIKTFLEEHKIDYPVVFDETGDLAANYQIRSFPNTFLIDKDGNVEGVIPGAVPKETFEMIIDQVLEK